MTPQELYALWAPPESVWSQWVLPVPFAQLVYVDAKGALELPHFDLRWLPSAGGRDVAIVADLAGEKAIHFGLALSKYGFRPVPVIDGSPGPPGGGLASLPMASNIVVDMHGLMNALCLGAEYLRAAALAANAPPAFLLDSKRMESATKDLETAYDNRWMAFPQDFPSGKFLQEQGIRKVVVVHDRFLKQPQEDLAHVLLRWQEAGLTIESKST